MSELLHGEEERAYGDSGYTEQRNVRKQSKRTKMAKISSTSSTDVHLQSENYPEAVSMPLRKGNIRNHLSAAKSNTFLQ